MSDSNIKFVSTAGNPFITFITFMAIMVILFVNASSKIQYRQQNVYQKW